MHYSDSNNIIRISIDKNTLELKEETDIGKFISKELLKFDHTPHIHALVHPCHWTFRVNFRSEVQSNDLKSVIVDMHNSELKNKKFILQHAQNISGRDLSGNILKAYDNSYLTKRNYFQQEPYFGFLKKLIHVSTTDILNILEVGCGQGEFLYHAFCFAKNKKRGAEQEIRAVGIDASFVAIADCAVRYPQCQWVVSEGDDFLNDMLNKEKIYNQIPYQYDLILDKTGLTGIDDFPSAFAVLKKIHKILSPQGRYVYIASQEFYNRRYGDREKWPLHWAQIVAKVFDKVSICHDIPNQILLVCEK